MLTFPNAKINLGLNITEKRPDGYHNLETIFYPVPIEDALEINILNEGNGKFRLHQAGLEIEGEAESNLVVKAYKLLDDRFNLPPVDIHLFKHIPSGAGLGGGSADAAFMLKLLNNKFELGLPDDTLEEYAAKLGADVQTAKRAGLLHDLGKSIDHEMEGTHVQLGVEFARKYKEKEEIIHAIEAHHNDVEPRTIVACLVQAADAISAARPGARRENLENYIKRLEQLESIATSFQGVEKAYAIQAGREVRVMVKPEQVNEDQMVILARDLAKKIEEEMEYPGQIKVNLIRETKCVEYAK